MNHHTDRTDIKKKTGGRVLIFIAAVLTAIAVAVSFVFCLNVGEKVGVKSDMNGGVLTSQSYTNKTGDQSAQGALQNGDTITYSPGSIYSITLPRGEFTLEAWGGQGGYYEAATPGGLGGYTYVTFKPTSVTTLYICVGGLGGGTSSGVHAGGYNGGGSTSISNSGGGGGGATHFAFNQGALLRNTTSSNVLLVAGGGGGSTTSAHSGTGGQGGYGGGGNNPGGSSSGGWIDGSGYQAGGGQLNGGGSAGYGATSSSCTAVRGSDGGYGYGGDSTSATYEQGGGGGGGYYGGGGGGGDNDSSGADGRTGGGGGSGYIKSGYSGGGTSNNHSGAGSAKITVVNVNQPPKATSGVGRTMNARGVASSISLTAGNLATDPEGTAVYFTNGTANAYDDMTQTANAGLFVNSACTTSANKYFTWTWQSKQQFTLTGVIKFPRPGVDGCTASGNNSVITLYTKVRDNFGTTSTRGTCLVSFTITVVPNTVALNTGIVSGASNVGTSVAGMAAPDNPANATGIYNPNGGGINTLFIKQALVMNQNYTTITAASLVKNCTSITAGYDKAYIALDSTTAVTGSTRKYMINELDANTNKATIYDSNKNVIANVFDQITLKCLNPDANYQVLPIKIYVVEKSTVISGYSNVVPNIAAIPLQIVFKMENSRPVLKSGQSNIVNLNVGQSLGLSLNTYFSDVDTATISTSTHSITGVVVPKKEFVLINKQKVVTAPAAPNAGYYNVGYTAGSTLDGDPFTTSAQGTTATGTDSGGFKDGIAYNATSPVAGTSREQAFISFTYSGITLNVTGLRSSFSQYTASRANTAPGHFYLLIHIRDARDTADNGIWLPIAFTVGKETANTSHAPVATITDPSSSITGQAKSSYYPVASGSATDSFYFAPMAVSSSGMNVIGKYVHDGVFDSNGLQPLALDGDNFTTVTGTSTWTGNKLNELLRISDATTLASVVRSVCGSTTDDYYSEGTDDDGNAYAENQYFRAYFIDVYYPTTYFATSSFGGGRVIAGSGTADGYGFKYVNMSQRTASDGQNYYIGKGLRIVLKSATMNRYFYATVGITDCTGKSVNDVKIAIRVNNSAPYAFRSGDAKVAVYGDRVRSNAYSTYEYDPDNAVAAQRVSIPTVTYKIALDASVIITPYDFAYDTQLGDAMRNANVSQIANGFTLNGLSGSYNAAAGRFTVGGTAAGGDEAFTGVFGSAYSTPTYVNSLKSVLNVANRQNTVGAVSGVADGRAYGVAINSNQKVYNDKLFFARRSAMGDAFTNNTQSFNDFAANISNADGFLTVAYGSKVNMDSTDYSVDFIKLTAVRRTTQPAVISMTVSDRYGDSSDSTGTFTVRIVIEVVNTRPHIVDPSYYMELAATPITSSGAVVTDKSYVFAADGNSGNGLMADHDGDTPAFITARGVVVANTREIADRLNFESFDAVEPELLVDADGVPLTDYVTAELVTDRELLVTAVSSTKAIETGVFVYFFVTDKNGGVSVGYVQVEVVNTSPRLNTSDVDGFDASNPLWSVISTSEKDIQRERYIVGAESTKAVLKDKLDTQATDADIKLIAVDDDGRHTKTVLSQCRIDDVEGHNYINLNFAAATDRRTALELAVPSVKTSGQTDFTGSAASVVIFTRSSSGITAGAPSDNYSSELFFYVNDGWISRAEVINTLAADGADVSDYFDTQGRWIVSDWALRLRATSGFAAGAQCGIGLSVRDQADIGGDTANKKTAYSSNRNKTTDGVLDNKVDVEGRLITTVYQFISQTGLMSINDFLGKNDNYYTVEYKETEYVPTYDGNVDSVYGDDDDTSDIKYKTEGEDRYLVYPEESGYDTATVIKQRSKPGTALADNTKAGTNAGVPYSSGTTVSGAFVYKDVIEIPSETTDNTEAGDNEHPAHVPVYVPMSYFGLMSTLATAAAAGESGVPSGSVVYSDNYVGYKVSGTFGLGDISNFASALTVSDGNMNWSGAELNDNPYINISAFYHNGTTENSEHYFTTDRYSEYSRPYYNNRLAVRTVDADGKLYGYEKIEANRNNFIGDGKLMYLAEQATKLKEHNFGLVFTKKHERTGVNNLTFTVNLAKSKGNANVAPDTAANETESDITRTVTVKIHIQNSKIDLYSSDSDSVVKYDEVKGTYYTDLNMRSSDSATFALSRKSKSNDAVETIKGYERATKIPYYDDDYSSETYRDFAYFLNDSFNRLDRWNIGSTAYKRAVTVSGGVLVNTVATDYGETVNRSKAQNSVANYFGKSKNIAAVENVDGSYLPNNGMYGSDIEKFSRYFNATLIEDGRVLTVMPVRKTEINEFALKELLGETPKPSAVIAEYAKRGLVAVYPDSTDLEEPSASALRPSRVYYPLKTLIYDSCGLGWDDGSYVAIEIRISIVNGAPSLKNVGTPTQDSTGARGREFTLNLAVGNTITVNLYDIVSDPDIFTVGGNGLYSLATEAQFKNEATGIARETGDYLDSPLKYEFPPYQANNATKIEDDGAVRYYRNGGGFSERGSKDRDVIMWMDRDTDNSTPNNPIPSSNSIAFTVNRRTTWTTPEGQSVSINEYRFTLKFTDGQARDYTEFFTFIINVTNQAPSIAVTERTFTMRADDDLTVLTSYYDVFTGAAGGMTTAYSNSMTSAALAIRQRDPAYIQGLSGDGRNNDTNGGYWKFADITSAACSSDVIHDSTLRDERNVHLGYYALANDDTPWRLRIIGVETGEDKSKLWIDYEENMIRLPDESSGVNTPVALHIRARSACTNYPVTITLSDGEGGITSCTLYFTVISSKPVAIDCSDPDESTALLDGMEGVTGTDGLYIPGTFRLFTVPDEEGGTYRIAGTERSARKTYRINMTNVATDPDGATETNNMTLYQDGQFSVNGVPLVRNSNGVYRSDYFDITTDDGGKAFIITATGYNPDSTNGYEELKFLIEDYGKRGDFDNALEITIRVYTTYSDIRNPSVGAKTETDYKNAYLKGSEVVTVKSYDEFYGSVQGVPRTRYAFMNLQDNVGNDGNTLSPIVDPDVTKVGEKPYGAKLYAFINFDASQNITALSSETLENMFDRTGGGVFKLKSGGDYSQYMIGGVEVDGTVSVVADTARARLSAIEKYVDFDFEGDGTSLVFSPRASTLGNKNILLYVEVEKNMGTRSAYLRDDAVFNAGSLFRLDVKDSAPIAVGGNHSGSGRVGDTLSFKIFDADDPYSALFVDSDEGDIVTVEDFDAAKYESAMSQNTDLDWRATASKPQAFEITVNDDLTLGIKINRRIDKIVSGVYQPEVTFPVTIIGKDKMGLSASVTVTITIANTDITAGPDKTEIDDETGVGYTFARDFNDSYNLDVSVKYGRSLDIEISDFVRDTDYTTVEADTDSFRFVAIENIHPYACLVNDPVSVEWFKSNDDGTPNEDVSEVIATVEPLGDVNHRTGIRITADASVRSLTATMYMRILDRAANPSIASTGVVIRVNITVMNDAPYVLPGKEAQTIYMTGSDKSEPTGMLFYIGEFVADRNTSDVVGDDESMHSDTYLRVLRQEARAVNHLYSTVYSQVKEGSDDTSNVDSSSLFMVTVPNQLDEALVQAYCDARGLTYDYKDLTNAYKQWFVVTPIRGFFGDGAIDISVADGDVSTQYDTLITTFRLNVHVIYNARETENALDAQTIACSKTKTIDISTLMPDLENKLNFDNGNGDKNNVFNQSEYYRIVSVAFQDSADGNKATFEKVGDTSAWTLTAGNQITIEPIRVNVRIAPINDPENFVSKFFWLNIIANQAPKMRYKEITFRSKAGETPDTLRDLNGNGMIRLEAWQLFDDPDDPQGSALRLLSVSSQVSALVKASLEKDETGVNRYVVLKFVGRGESEITVKVTDETGVAVNLTFLARNDDLPKASLWVRMSASFEAHKVMWTVIICCIVLLILILIIIITVVTKRKRAREELEALLVSEMEIEEEMLRLAGGPSPTDYRSYGYLQSQDGGDQAMLDPGINDITPADDAPDVLPPGGDLPPQDGDLGDSGDM